MGNIKVRPKKDGSKSYQARVRINGIYKSATFSKKVEAQRWIQQIETDIGRGSVTDSKPFKLLAELYMKNIVPNQRGYAEARNTLFWMEELGHIPCDDITTNRILQALEKKDSNAYKNRLKAKLSSIFKYGAE